MNGTARASCIVLLIAGSASASPELQRISDAPDPWLYGNEANRASRHCAISRTGRFVAFESDAGNLLPEPGSGATDVYLLDRDTGLLERISVGADGLPRAGAVSGRPSVSEDGRFVAFESRGGDFDPNFPPLSTRQIFVRDRQIGYTSMVSHATAAPGDLDSGRPRITPDGQWVAFESRASNLNGDPPYTPDVYRVSRFGGDPVRGHFRGVSTNPRISDDGNVLVYDSTDAGGTVGNAVWRLDIAANLRVEVSVDDSGAWSNGPALLLDASADGRRVLFQADADNLDGPGLAAHYGVYLRNLDTGITRLISRGPLGDPVYARLSSGRWQGALTADGSHVLLAGDAEGLVTGDLAPMTRIYRRELSRGVNLLFDPDADGASAAPAASADPDRFCFDSLATNLVDDDRNAVRDVFDYRRVGEPRPGVVRAVASRAEQAQPVTSGSEASHSPTLSADASRLVYLSAAGNLDEERAAPRGDGLDLILLHDFVAGSQQELLKDHAIASDVLEPSLSADGRYLVFATRATLPRIGLPAQSSSVNTYVYRMDLSDRSLLRLTSKPAGSASAGEAREPTISGDGSRVLFRSSATDLDPAMPGFDTGPWPGLHRLYLWQEGLGVRAVLPPAPHADPAAAVAVQAPRLSADGGSAVFLSTGEHLLPDGGNGYLQAFALDLDSGAVSLLSDSSGAPRAADSASPDISADGRWVAFIRDLGQPGESLLQRDRQWGHIHALSRDEAGVDAFSALRLSADGHFAAVGASLGADQRSWRWNVLGANLTRLDAQPLPSGASLSGLAIDARGRYLAFASDDDALLPDDRNGRHDVYRARFDFDRIGFTSASATLELESDGSGTARLSVQRIGNLDEEVAVDYRTEDGSALQDVDYHRGWGTLRWPAGDGSPMPIELFLIGRDDAPGSRSFTVRLHDPLGAELGAIAVATVALAGDGAEPGQDLIFRDGFGD